MYNVGINGTVLNNLFIIEDDSYFKKINNLDIYFSCVVKIWKVKGQLKLS